MSNNVLTATINPEKLSLADWLEIAVALNYERLGAFDAFIKPSSLATYNLSTLTLEDWEQLAQQVRCDKHWANWKYYEYTERCKQQSN